jgi:hypothetical protein
MAQDAWRDPNSFSFYQKESADTTSAVTDLPDAPQQKAKPDPEYRIKSLSVELPSQGLAEGGPFTVVGEVQLISDKVSRPRILLDALTEYQNQKDYIKRGLETFIDNSNKFKATFQTLYYHDGFLRDKSKAADAKFALSIIAIGATAEKEFQSLAISLPTPPSAPAKTAHVYSAVDSLEGTAKVGTKQCVALLVEYIKAPSTTLWAGGEAVFGNSAILKGTAIATFVNGKYQSLSTGNHAAFYLSQDETGIKVMDQWANDSTKPKVSSRHLPRKGKNSGGSFVDPSNNADAYSVALW